MMHVRHTCSVNTTLVYENEVRTYERRDDRSVGARLLVNITMLMLIFNSTAMKIHR